MSANRLSTDLWIAAGFEALIDQGPKTLKAESLARRLNTTKGSFYWHFKDVADFYAAMLCQWENQAKADLEAAQDEDVPPAQALRTLSQTIVAGTQTGTQSRSADAAVRAWSHDYAVAAEAVSRVDAARLEHLNAALIALDLSNPELSRILYGASLGMTELTQNTQTSDAAAMGTLVDLILALYQ